MPRFFVPPEAINGQSFTLTGSEARHAALVLRKKVADVIDLFDGKDLSYQGRIDVISPERIEGTIVSQTTESRFSTINLILCQALIKGPKWDWLVEKACEIGVTRLVPLITARTVVKPSRETAQARWNRIALSASKQCGRPDVMKIDDASPLDGALKRLPQNSLALIPWEKETAKTIRQAYSPSPAIAVFIGPEGGWETDEVNLAVGQGAIPVCLGPNLLRSETAGLVAAALVLAES